MIVHGTSTIIDGLELLGETFVPADEDSAYAVFVRGHRSCGLTFEMNHGHPYLRCSPGLMLPVEARDKNAWMRAAWHADDERLLDVRIDLGDGELIYIDSDDELVTDVEGNMTRALDFLLGDDFNDFVTSFVFDCMEHLI